MVQRISNYERQPRDLYETPEWVTHALLRSKLVPFYKLQWWEPTCASGKIAREVKDMFGDCVFFAGKGVLTSRIVFIDRPGASPTTNHAWYTWSADREFEYPIIQYLDKV